MNPWALKLAILVFLGLSWLALVPGPAPAADYSVTTCPRDGSSPGPVPANFSRGSFSAATDCRTNAGGQTGFVMRPTNQGAGQTASRSGWAALEWQVPAGVYMRRAQGELGGTSANGSGSGFGSHFEGWMFRTFGLADGRADLFAARFSVPNNSYFFSAGDAPGLYGWYWGNSSGGLGTPTQWNSGQPYDFSRVHGTVGKTMFPIWSGLQVGDSAVTPARPPQVPSGPYRSFRAELRCNEPTCRSDGFTEVQLQNFGFKMADDDPPDRVTARVDPGDPLSARLAAGDWLSSGTAKIIWTGHDAGTGISGAGLTVDGEAAGVGQDSPCPGGRPGEVRVAFKPCGEGAYGRLDYDVARAPQGVHRLGVCVKDGISAPACVDSFGLHLDSIVPAVDSATMELRPGSNGTSVLTLVNPDAADIAAGKVSPLKQLIWRVEVRGEGGFEPFQPERTVDIADGGAGEISTPELDLEAGRTYRVCARLGDVAGNVSTALACTVLIADAPAVEPPPPAEPADPVIVRVPSRKYCALTGFTIRPDRRGMKATLTAKRYSRFVRIQFFRNTRAVRGILASGRYRRLRDGTPTGPVVNLKRKAVKDHTGTYRFPKINLRTYPALYRMRGDSLIAVPRVSNEWNRCTVRYRQRLDRRVSDLGTWKLAWGISDKYRLLNHR